MDEAAIKAAIAEGIKSALEPIQTAIHALEEVATKPPAEPPKPENPGTPDPLANRVALLEQELEAKTKAEQAAKFGDSIGSLLDSYNPKSSSIAKEILISRFKEATLTDAGYVLKDGKSLADGVSAFFGTPDGKSLLKGSRIATGNGIESGQEVVSPPQGEVNLMDLSF